MSRKWIRSKKWDDEHLPPFAWPVRLVARRGGVVAGGAFVLLGVAALIAIGVVIANGTDSPRTTTALVWSGLGVLWILLWPVKFILRALSSITLAVILLSLVAIYGTLASIPLGMLAETPTYALYLLIFLVMAATINYIPLSALNRKLTSRGMERAGRFAILLPLTLVSAIALMGVFGKFVLPWLHEGMSGQGIRLFGDFAERYSTVTLRRLPAFEMSEVEFYAWWPMRVILLLFVLNMIVATLRRIEFVFVNLGVLSVHTGIVLIGLGSVYYQSNKQEGDMLLTAGDPITQGEHAGRPGLGPWNPGFFDRNDVAIWLNQARGWEQRPLTGLPRYNAYDLDVLGTGFDYGTEDGGRSLDIEVPPAPDSSRVSSDLQFRIVGYAPFVELAEELVEADLLPGETARPLRRVEVIARALDAAPNDPSAEVRRQFDLAPTEPARRVMDLAGVLDLEYHIGMDEERFEDLTARAMPETQHALVVEVPDANFRSVYPIAMGQSFEVGTTGFTIEVSDLLPSPPFSVRTPGFEDIESSVAIVRVKTPEGPDAEVFDRWLYSRYPELTQDLVESTDEASPMPTRRGPDDAIRLTYLDLSTAQVFLVENEDDTVNAIVRPARGTAVVYRDIPISEEFNIATGLWLRVTDRIEHVRKIETPRIIPELDRNRDAVGTHLSAALALEIMAPDPTTGELWSRVIWLPFSQYIAMVQGNERLISTPAGPIRLAFGRRWHQLPGLRLRLVDFEMIPYPHSDVPRDYRSDLLVERRKKDNAEVMEASTSLNHPLLVKAPYRERTDLWAPLRPVAASIAWIVPNQYKFAQAGWDANGWRQRQELVEQGLIERPFASYTILGVGNNPGIYIIAAGAILMSLGIPWAFYVKPYIVKRRKRLWQERIAASSAEALEDAPETPEAADREMVVEGSQSS